ncbi:protein kinase domain-containing protein [Oceanospirillum sediminis]|uniref:Protein kinase domain-containing protein n=1 Tax=Oceanospirillum sediminis TaxID=2760088 RepID=A0A839IPI9_9GAMM|nr:AarF/UbiB family protein [Oceanospirillum sediminis]MBB1486600.1 hypothetical protein [Oceanospirillum sediminis]
MSLTESLPALLSERWECYGEICPVSPCVWRLRHKATQQWHYLKLAQESVQQKLLANEIHWLSVLTGDYLPEVIAVSEDRHKSPYQPRTWLLTGQVPGQPLNQLIRSNQINRADYHVIISGLFTVLRHCHQQGVVHSDIKPANLIWCRESQQLSLIDWGSANRPGRLISEQPWRSFSPSYSPPALQRGEGHLSSLADWYSFLIMDQLLQQQPLPVFDWQQPECVSRYYSRHGYCPALSEEQRMFLYHCMLQLNQLG